MQRISENIPGDSTRLLLLKVVDRIKDHQPCDQNERDIAA